MNGSGGKATPAKRATRATTVSRRERDATEAAAARQRARERAAEDTLPSKSGPKRAG